MNQLVNAVVNSVKVLKARFIRPVVEVMIEPTRHWLLARFIKRAPIFVGLIYQTVHIVGRIHF